MKFTQVIIMNDYDEGDLQKNINDFLKENKIENARISIAVEQGNISACIAYEKTIKIV